MIPIREADYAHHIGIYSVFWYVYPYPHPNFGHSGSYVSMEAAAHMAFGEQPRPNRVGVPLQLLEKRPKRLLCQRKAAAAFRVSSRHAQ